MKYIAIQWNIFIRKKIFSFDKKRMSRDFRRDGHQAFMAWSQSFLFINMATVSDSSWENVFSGLVNLLDIYENYSLDINLDFPSAAILFNQFLRNFKLWPSHSTHSDRTWIRIGYTCGSSSYFSHSIPPIQLDFRKA